MGVSVYPEAFGVTVSGSINTSGGGAGSGISWERVSSSLASEEVKANKGYTVNTSGGQVTIPLPDDPREGDKIAFADDHDFSANNLIIAQNNNGHTINGTNEDMTVSTKGAAPYLVYNGHGDWRLA